MANIFKPKRSSTASSVPTTSDLADGEIAVNSSDKKIYLRDGQSIVEVANASTDGSSLTNLNATNLASGTIPDARFPSALPAIDGSALTGITAEGTGAIGGLTVKNQSGVVVGTGGSVSTIDFDGSQGVTVTATTGSSGIATVVISADLVTDTSPQLGGTLDTNGNLIQFGDSGSSTDDRLQFGASQDLQIYHDGSHSYIDDAGTGNLHLRSGTLSIQNLAGSKTSAVFNSGGKQEFYFNNTKRLETTSTGAVVTGILTATSFSGDGSNLTNINATIAGISTTGTSTFNTVSVSNALYIPQYTTTARDAGSFNEGAMIYNTTTKKMEFYDGTNWVTLPGVTLGLGMGVF